MDRRTNVRVDQSSQALAIGSVNDQWGIRSPTPSANTADRPPASSHRDCCGESFGVASVHKILTNTVYIGQWKFNKTSSRTRQRKPDEEVVTIPVPGPDRAARIRAGSAPASCPQSASGRAARYDRADPADGFGDMRHLSGWDDVADRHVPERDVHRYFTCSTCARKVKSACNNRHRMDKLDGLVTEHLVERLFEPERLATILALQRSSCRKGRERQ